MKTPNLVQRCTLANGKLNYDYMGSSEYESGDQQKAMKRIFASGELKKQTMTVTVNGKPVQVYMIAGKEFLFDGYLTHLEALANDKYHLQEATYFNGRILAQQGEKDRFKTCEFAQDINVWFDFENDVLFCLSAGIQHNLEKKLKEIKTKWAANAAQK